MSEEKLTVAELLARRQKEGATSELPRRRRRRSLEEGGVSVQELTGSIPRVKAGEPRRGAHALSNAEDEQTTTSDLLADDAETSAAEEAHVPEEAQVTESQPEAPEQQVQSEDAAESQVVAEDADSSEPETDAEAESETELPDEVEGESEAELEDESAPDKPVQPQPVLVEQDAQTAQASVAPLPLAIPMEPRLAMIDVDRSEFTYTFTELRDMSDDSRTVGQPGPVARSILAGSNAYDDRPTTSMTVVTDTTDQPAEPATEEISERQAHAMPQVSQESDATDNIEDVDADTDSDTETGADTDAADASEATVATVVAPEDAPAEMETDEKESESQDGLKRETTDERADYAENNSLSVPLLLIQVFVGLIAGALVFLGFTMAWSSLPKVVVVIMALAVTGGFTGMASYVRRKKDWVTPILAGLVGLALTFGPWILYQL